MIGKRKIGIILLVINILAVWGTIMNQCLSEQQPDVIRDAIVNQTVDEEQTDKETIDIEVGSLRKGVYDLEVSYETDLKDVYLCVESIEMGKSAVYADDFLLNPNAKSLKTQFWMNHSADNFDIKISYGGDDEKGVVKIHNVTIKKNTLGSCTYDVLKMLVILFCLDCSAYLLLERERLRKYSGIIIGLFCIIVISSLGLLNEGWRKRDDTVFHLARIWGLACGISNGDFPVRIQPEWANGYGFAVSVFYGDLFLYIPAVLVLLKTPLYVAYKIYILVINIGTALLSYFSFKEISGDRKIGISCSAAYTLSIYRLCDIYYRDAVGEYTAIMFLPLIVMGVWKILFEDVRENKYKRNWIYLSIGMAGVAHSHVLSCEMIALFLAIISIIMIKRIFSEKRYREFIKAMIGTLCLSLSFLIPFLKYSTEDLNVFIKQPFYRIQKYGISISELLRVWGTGAGVSQYEEVTAMAISIGLPAALTVLACIYLLYGHKNIKNSKKMQCILGLLLLSLWMATDIFPYNSLEELSVFKMLIGSLQFPFRFMSMAMCFTALLICLVGMCCKKNLQGTQFTGIVLALCVICACQGMQYIQHAEEQKTLVFTKSDGAEWTAGYDTLSGGQYLYRGTDYKKVTESKPEITGGGSVTNYQREGLKYMITCHTDADTTMRLPSFYYPDYKCWDVDTKAQFPTVKGDNNELWIKLPADYKGTLKVTFVEPVLWRAAEIISLLAVIGYCIIFWNSFKKK